MISISRFIGAMACILFGASAFFHTAPSGWGIDSWGPLTVAARSAFEPISELPLWSDSQALALYLGCTCLAFSVASSVVSLAAIFKHGLAAAFVGPLISSLPLLSSLSDYGSFPEFYFSSIFSEPSLSNQSGFSTGSKTEDEPILQDRVSEDLQTERFGAVKLALATSLAQDPEKVATRTMDVVRKLCAPLLMDPIQIARIIPEAYSLGFRGTGAHRPNHVTMQTAGNSAEREYFEISIVQVDGLRIATCKYGQPILSSEHARFFKAAFDAKQATIFHTAPSVAIAPESSGDQAWTVSMKTSNSVQLYVSFYRSIHQPTADGSPNLVQLSLLNMTSTQIASRAEAIESSVPTTEGPKTTSPPSFKSKETSVPKSYGPSSDKSAALAKTIVQEGLFNSNLIGKTVFEWVPESSALNAYWLPVLVTGISEDFAVCEIMTPTGPTSGMSLKIRGSRLYSERQKERFPYGPFRTTPPPARETTTPERQCRTKKRYVCAGGDQTRNCYFESYEECH